MTYLDVGPLQSTGVGPGPDIGPLQSGSAIPYIEGEADGVGDAQCTLGAATSLLMLSPDMTGGFSVQDMTGGFDG